MSLMPNFVPTPMRVSSDRKTWWLSNIPVAIEVSGYDLVIWDTNIEAVISSISVVDAAGQFRGSATIARELKNVVDIFKESYELGRERRYVKILIKSYVVLIQHRDEEPKYVPLGVVADEIENWVTDIDEYFYFYMTQSEFDSHKTLIGVELDDGTYIRDYDPLGQPDILIGNVLDEGV